jgi:hypothetical protein
MALHAAGIKREDWKVFYGLLLVEISKEHSSNCNFYKVLKGEEVVYEVEINIANNQTSTISVV